MAKKAYQGYWAEAGKIHKAKDWVDPTSKQKQKTYQQPKDTMPKNPPKTPGSRYA